MIKLSEIVAGALDDANLGSAEYAKGYRAAIRGLRELSWDIVGETKTVPVVVNSDKTILYPTDCVKILDFGIADGCGGIASFDKVEVLTFDDEVVDYEDQYDGDNPINGGNPLWLYNFPDTLEVSLGIGSYTSIGEYKLNEKSRQIIISPRCEYDSFLLKYLSDSKCQDEVHDMLAPALVAYIRWKTNQAGTRNTVSVQEYNKQEWLREKRLAKLRIKMPSLQQLSKAVRQSVKMAVKS